MMQRCYDPKATQFKYYGGRGIAVCEKWWRFGGFLEDMGERPEGKTLSRKNNDEGYTKTNCQWDGPEEQMRNRSNTRWIELEGAKMTTKEFASRVGVVPSTLYNRYAQGWSAEQIISHYVK